MQAQAHNTVDTVYRSRRVWLGYKSMVVFMKNILIHAEGGAHRRVPRVLFVCM